MNEKTLEFENASTSTSFPPNTEDKSPIGSSKPIDDIIDIMTGTGPTFPMRLSPSGGFCICIGGNWVCYPIPGCIGHMHFCGPCKENSEYITSVSIDKQKSENKGSINIAFETADNLRGSLNLIGYRSSENGKTISINASINGSPFFYAKYHKRCPSFRLAWSEEQIKNRPQEFQRIVFAFAGGIDKVMQKDASLLAPQETSEGGCEIGCTAAGSAVGGAAGVGVGLACTGASVGVAAPGCVVGGGAIGGALGGITGGFCSWLFCED